MNVREAILKAADYIERNPAAYSFHSNEKPSCEVPGCLGGWVGEFAGLREQKGEAYAVTVAKFLGHVDLRGMLNAFTEIEWHRPYGARRSFQISAAEGACVLRLYADKYHPAPKSEHVGIPAAVRAIFESEPVNV